MAIPGARLGWGLMSVPHAAVSPILLKVLERLGEAGVAREFYLAGDTGLALSLHHRRSVDLDFFSQTNRLDFEGRRSLTARLEELPRWRLIEAKDGTVHGQVGQVRVSFFWYPQPLAKPLIRKGRIRIAAIEDIGLMKVGAIIGRGSRKDFVDLYAICQQLPLSRLLVLGGRKFRRVRDFRLQALKALAFFDDAEREPPLVIPASLAWSRVTAFFNREVRVLARRYLSPS